MIRIVAVIELGSLRIILIPESKKGVPLIKMSLKKCSAYCVLYSGSAGMVMSSLLFPGFVWLFLLPDFVLATSNNFQIELLCCSLSVFFLFVNWLTSFRLIILTARIIYRTSELFWKICGSQAALALNMCLLVSVTTKNTFKRYWDGSPL